MKKYLIALMVLVLALALVACGETADTTVPATDHQHYILLYCHLT